ncbi:glycosyltransferase [Lysinibacillus xylanilyticus]|uniref:glycosyltransferase n=1 Tax=Lysinibacillus xylanilyticus TaxID=582475 RepID=UPI003D03B393
MQLTHKIARYIKYHGFKGLINKVIGTAVYKIKRQLSKKENQKQLEILLNEHADKEIIVYFSPVPWNLPLYQRPHHIALNLANSNYLYFYCTNNPVKDNLNGFRKIANSCYLTNQQDILLGLSNKKIIHLYSTDMRDIGEVYEKAIKNNDVILYEYIDELHKDITGEIPEYVFKNHQKLLKDDVNCVVIASADKLLADVKSHRSKNYKLVTNGVDFNHFNKNQNNAIPNEIRDLVEKKRPIIGYFGAFASWFDYELVLKLAVERPDYEILLIGWDYDKSIVKYNLDKVPNITVIGPIDYSILPDYSKWFDVSTIPFKINEVTESTSPVKLFEYMAMGKPIVTTNMKECRKYKSVLIAKNSEQFIGQIDRALQLENDKKYLKLIKEEAMINTWKEKAQEILYVLKESKEEK